VPPARTTLFAMLNHSRIRPGGEQEMAHNRLQMLIRPNVRFGSKADMCSAKGHARLTPKSGHVRCKEGRPLCANSGHGKVTCANNETAFAAGSPKPIRCSDGCHSLPLPAPPQSFIHPCVEVYASSTGGHLLPSVLIPGHGQ
jgi:hypothetical protein